MAEQTTTDKSPDKSGAPPCGLYLRIPADPDMEAWQPRMIGYQYAIKSANKYAKNMHVVEIAVDDEPAQDAIEKAAAFVQIAQLNGIVAIIAGQAKFAKILEADGVLLDDKSDIAAARELLEDEAIIGLNCDMKPAIAQDAIKSGADYICFGNPVAAPDVKNIAEWSTASDKPAAALGPITNDTASLYVMAGATFLDTTHYLTTLPKGPAQAVINMLHAIDLALETRAVN